MNCLTEETPRSSSINEPVSEFKMGVKVLLFDGENSMRWITRSELYFEVQDSPKKVEVKLTKLSMDGAIINLFKSST